MTHQTQPESPKSLEELNRELEKLTEQASKLDAKIHESKGQTQKALEEALKIARS